VVFPRVCDTLRMCSARSVRGHGFRYGKEPHGQERLAWLATPGEVARVNLAPLGQGPALGASPARHVPASRSGPEHLRALVEAKPVCQLARTFRGSNSEERIPRAARAAAGARCGNVKPVVESREGAVLKRLSHVRWWRRSRHSTRIDFLAPRGSLRLERAQSFHLTEAASPHFVEKSCPVGVLHQPDAIGRGP